MLSRSNSVLCFFEGILVTWSVPTGDHSDWSFHKTFCRAAQAHYNPAGNES